MPFIVIYLNIVIYLFSSVFVSLEYLIINWHRKLLKKSWIKYIIYYSVVELDLKNKTVGRRSASRPTLPNTKKISSDFVPSRTSTHSTKSNTSPSQTGVRGGPTPHAPHMGSKPPPPPYNDNAKVTKNPDLQKRPLR